MVHSTVLIASRTEQENLLLRRKLEPLTNDFTNLNIIGGHPQGLSALVDSKLAVAILNFNEWGRRESVHLAELKQANFKGSTLVIAKSEVNAATRALHAMDKVVFLEKPFEVRDLIGIVRKMLSARAVAQRVHRRFMTSQDAEIEFEARKGRLFSRVCNLSKGGAYLEFMTGAAVSIGETVRLRVELKQLNRTYTMPAKVIWTNRAEVATGIGIEFQGPGDVERLVLGSY